MEFFQKVGFAYVDLISRFFLLLEEKKIPGTFRRAGGS